MSGLKEPDAAKLFLQRIHRCLWAGPAVWSLLELFGAVRMLDDRDFPDPVVGNADAGGGVWNPRSSCTMSSWGLMNIAPRAKLL